MLIGVGILVVLLLLGGGAWYSGKIDVYLPANLRKNQNPCESVKDLCATSTSLCDAEKVKTPEGKKACEEAKTKCKEANTSCDKHIDDKCKIQTELCDADKVKTDDGKKACEDATKLCTDSKNLKSGKTPAAKDAAAKDAAAKAAAAKAAAVKAAAVKAAAAKAAAGQTSISVTAPSSNNSTKIVNKSKTVTKITTPKGSLNITVYTDDDAIRDINKITIQSVPPINISSMTSQLNNAVSGSSTAFNKLDINTIDSNIKIINNLLTNVTTNNSSIKQLVTTSNNNSTIAIQKLNLIKDTTKKNTANTIIQKINNNKSSLTGLQTQLGNLNTTLQNKKTELLLLKKNAGLIKVIVDNIARISSPVSITTENNQYNTIKSGYKVNNIDNSITSLDNLLRGLNTKKTTIDTNYNNSVTIKNESNIKNNEIKGGNIYTTRGNTELSRINTKYNAIKNNKDSIDRIILNINAEKTKLANSKTYKSNIDTAITNSNTDITLMDNIITNNPSSLVPSEIITQRDRIKAKLVRLKTIMTTNYNSLKNIIPNNPYNTNITNINNKINEYNNINKVNDYFTYTDIKQPKNIDISTRGEVILKGTVTINNSNIVGYYFNEITDIDNNRVIKFKHNKGNITVSDIYINVGNFNPIKINKQRVIYCNGVSCPSGQKPVDTRNKIQRDRGDTINGWHELSGRTKKKVSPGKYVQVSVPQRTHRGCYGFTTCEYTNNTLKLDNNRDLAIGREITVAEKNDINMDNKTPPHGVEKNRYEFVQIDGKYYEFYTSGTKNRHHKNTWRLFRDFTKPLFE